MKLETIKSDSQRMSKVFDLAVTEVEKILSGKSRITDITKVAASSIATYSRIRSTEVHEMALRLMIEKNDAGIKQLIGNQK